MPTDSTDEADSDYLLPDSDDDLEWRPIVRRSFKCDGDIDLVKEIVSAVADAENTEITTLGSSLFEAVNVTAIEAIFFEQTLLGQQRHCSGKVHFRYRGFCVTVTSDGQVIVSEPVFADTLE